MNTKKRRIHLIGIGGAGMTALANILLKKGYLISGSDKKDFPARKILEKKGIKIYLKHKAENIKKDSIVIYSSAIQKDNIELKTAKKIKNPLFNRYEFLINILAGKKIISVAGTHGKSTTTAIIASILEKSNLKPTVYLGAKSQEYPLGSKWGAGKYAVVETDEHDKSFLKTPSFICALTNVDNDHLDIKGPYKGRFFLLKKAFRDFAEKSQSKLVVINADDNFSKELIKKSKKNFFKFGIKRKADISAKNINYESTKSKSDLFLDNKFLGKLRLELPGKENIYNALCAISVLYNIGIPVKKSLRYLKKMKGVKRRFSILYDKEITVIDDYAHHPTEIKSTLNTAKIAFPGRRIILVLEPHRYSRVSLLYQDFAQAVRKCNVLFLLPLDSASEKPMKGVSSRKIYKEIVRLKTIDKNKLHLVQDRKYFLENLLKFKKLKDVFIFAGPGKISNMTPQFTQMLKQNLIKKSS